MKRLIYSVLTLAVAATLTFFLMHLVPGGPFWGEKQLPETIRYHLGLKFGLNRPIWVQYIAYFKNVLSGDLGQSIKQPGISVADIITTSFPVSLRLGLVALSFSLTGGILLGILAALKKGAADKAVTLAATIGMSVPSFIVASLGMVVFGATFAVLPTSGLDGWQSYLMPAFSLSLFPLGFSARLMRSSMLGVISQDYLLAARAKGFKESSLIFRHALKNSAVPVITYFGPMTAALLTGSFAIEKIFTIPGLGKYFVDSITDCDYTVVMGTTIFYSAVLILMNFLVDLLCAALDPRLRADLEQPSG